MLPRGSSLQTSMHRAAFAKLKRRSEGKATMRVQATDACFDNKIEIRAKHPKALRCAF
jgi:hypothetical protein